MLYNILLGERIGRTFGGVEERGCSSLWDLCPGISIILLKICFYHDFIGAVGLLLMGFLSRQISFRSQLPFSLCIYSFSQIYYIIRRLYIRQ